MTTNVNNIELSKQKTIYDTLDNCIDTCEYCFDTGIKGFPQHNVGWEEPCDECNSFLNENNGISYDEAINAMKQHAENKFENVLEKIQKRDSEITQAISSQKQEGREVPDWLKGQRHAYKKVLEILNNAL